MEVLKQLIEEYNSEYRSHLNSHLEFYKNLESIEEVLKYAPSGEDYSPYKKHKHQWRVSVQAIESTRQNLLNIKAQILRSTKF